MKQTEDVATKYDSYLAAGKPHKDFRTLHSASTEFSWVIYSYTLWLTVSLQNTRVRFSCHFHQQHRTHDSDTSTASENNLHPHYHTLENSITWRFIFSKHVLV